MLSLIIVKAVLICIRTFTKYSGTALPGLIVETYFPKTFEKLLRNIKHMVLVTGTNGKTTTSRMLCHLLKKNNVGFISNPSGSNLLRGIASTLAENSDIAGNIKTNLAVFEIEEASLPKLTGIIRPDIIIVTNIFRDQLDAYGEIDKTYQYLKEGIEKSDNPRLILNADDERVRSLRNFSKNEVDLISFEKAYLRHIKFENRESKNTATNIKACEIRNVEVHKDLGISFDLSYGEGKIKKIATLSPGFHNAFNASAAIISFDSLSKLGVVKANKPDTSLSDFKPPFGRGEIIKVGNTKFQILLFKNPAGANLNLHLLESVQKREAVFLILNDNTAYGKDVSWIWDCDFTLLKNLNFKNVYISGTRAFELALRLKYEGIEVSQVDGNAHKILDLILKENFDMVYVLPTYTAMLSVRGLLSQHTGVKEIW